MKLYNSDIKVIHNTIWVSQRVLAVADVDFDYIRVRGRYRFNATLTPYYKDKLKSNKLNVMPDTGYGWRWARWNGQFYYDYDRIPNQAPVYSQSKLPTRDECIDVWNRVTKHGQNVYYNNAKLVIKKMAAERVCNTDIDSYMFDEYNLPEKKANEIVTARALCSVIKELADNYKEIGMNTAGDYWKAATSLVSKLNLEGLKINNPIALRNKIAHFPDAKKAQYNYLVSGKYGNTNKKVVGKFKHVDPETGEIFNFDLHEAIIYNLWMNPDKANKLNQTGVAGVYPRYKEQIESHGFDPVSERTVQFYISRFTAKSMTSLERDGADHFNSAYKPYIPQFVPKHTGSLWVADFSGTKLLYKDTVTKWNTNTGKKVTKQIVKSHYMCRIIDVASGNLLGWSISDKTGERWEDVVPALNMAIDNNHGYAAMELVTDNGGVWKKEESRHKLSRIFQKHRPITLGNKQANKAEYFVKMLSNYARQFENWSMLGFNAKTAANNANPDYLDIANIPTKAEAEMQIEKMVQQWNSTPRANGNIPEQILADKSNLHPELLPINEKTRRKHLGGSTTISIARSRSILSLGKGFSQHEYKIEDWAEVSAMIDKLSYGSTALKVDVCFDNKAADIYTLEGRYVTTAKAVEYSHATEFEASEASRQALRKHTESKERMRKAAERFTAGVRDTLVSAEADNVERELGYLQRAALNGGKAKDENLKIIDDDMNYEINTDDYIDQF